MFLVEMAIPTTEGDVNPHSAELPQYQPTVSLSVSKPVLYSSPWWPLIGSFKLCSTRAFILKELCYFSNIYLENLENMHENRY